MQLPSRRQILAKLEAEKQELADMKKDPIALDPDAESLARLKALKGETQKPAKPQLPVRTAQVAFTFLCNHLCCYQARSGCQLSIYEFSVQHFAHSLQLQMQFAAHAWHISSRINALHTTDNLW